MGIRRRLHRFVEDVTVAVNTDDLGAALRDMSSCLGFEFFALSHHVDTARVGAEAIRVHNYPAQWADYYDANGLGVTDPVHRASHVTTVGFLWSRIPKMIPLTREDSRILALGRTEGIGDGFTVPANVPGEALGSCSFANRAGVPPSMDTLHFANLVGLFAFEGARRLSMTRSINVAAPKLTDRQRDCLLWAGRGKSDWEISRILGISEETVDRHLKHARERYGVPKRTSVLVHALFDGTLSFTDILRH